MNENMICFSLNFILKEKLYILIKLEEVRLINRNRKLLKILLSKLNNYQTREVTKSY